MGRDTVGAGGGGRHRVVHGVRPAEVLSVVRGKSYLGDLEMVDPIPREWAWILALLLATPPHGTEKRSTEDALGFSSPGGRSSSPNSQG